MKTEGGKRIFSHKQYLSSMAVWLYGYTTTLFSEIIHGESSFNQNMLILVAGSNLCIMKCGLMGKIAVPSALSLTKWFLLCNKEHIKLVAVFLTLQPFPS